MFFGGRIGPRVEELPEDLTIFWRTGISANSFIEGMMVGSDTQNYVVVLDIFYFRPENLGKWSNLTHIFRWVGSTTH